MISIIILLINTNLFTALNELLLFIIHIIHIIIIHTKPNLQSSSNDDNDDDDDDVDGNRRKWGTKVDLTVNYVMLSDTRLLSLR